MCRRRVGVHVGVVCEKHDEKCVICDAVGQQKVKVRICDECAVSGNCSLAYVGSSEGGVVREGTSNDTTTTSGNTTTTIASSTVLDTAKCIVCSANNAKHPAYYCANCVLLERDRDGCPRVFSTAQHKRDAHYKHTMRLV